MQTREKAETSEEKLRVVFRKQLLLVAGLGQKEVDEMDLLSMTEDEIQRVYRNKLLGTQAANGSKQKVVTVSEANDSIRLELP